MDTIKKNIKPDNHNYRIHNEKNQELINKSLKDLGAGRSILLDNEDMIIAGNGVFEQAEKLGIPIKVIETDGRTLIAIKRIDLSKNDNKRKLLALADNKTSDTSTFNYDLIEDDFEILQLDDWGFDEVDPDLLGEPTDLTSDKKNNPPTIKITFESQKQMEEFETHIQALLDEEEWPQFKGSKYSISQGEL